MRELFGERPAVDASREGGEGPADAVVLDPFQASTTHTGSSCNTVDNFSLAGCEDGNFNPLCSNALVNTLDDPESSNFYPYFGELYGDWYFESSEDWFTFTLPCPATFTVNMCGNNTYDTCIAVLDGALNPLIVVDDWYNCPSSGLFGSMEVSLPAGTYYALVGGYYDLCGDYEATFGFDLECNSAGTVDRPVAFQLGEAFPNPFNPSTTIDFSLAETAEASLKVFNLAGAEVATLVSGLTAAGEHSVVFDASGLTSGVYFYTLEVAGAVETRRMTLVK